MTSANDLVALARENALNQPDKSFAKIWRTSGSTDFSYGALWERASAFAGVLQDRGVMPGESVIVSHELAPDLYAAFLGAMAMGAIPSIMPYPNAKQREEIYWNSHQKLYAQISPAAFILSDKVAAMYSEHMPQLAGITIRASRVGAAANLLERSTIKPCKIAFLQHSSGTTALKKGVMLSHEVVLRHVRTYAALIGCTRDSTIASWLPLYHDMGLIACFIMPLVLGSTVLSIDPFEWTARPRLMLDAISRGRAQFAWMPNFGFEHLVNSVSDPKSFELSSLEALINCSEPCRFATHRRFIEHFASTGLRRTAMQACYAMAENVFAVAQTPRGQPAAILEVERDSLQAGLICLKHAGASTVKLISCGTPIESTAVRIVDDQRRPTQDGSIGEIVVRSNTLFNGYNRRPDLTARTLSDGWYYTNDLGFMHNGELYVTGRRDDLIVTYGRNYYAHELEAIVNEVDGIRPGRSVVFGLESERTGTRDIIVLFEPIEVRRGSELATVVRRRIEAAAGLQAHHVEAVMPGSLIKTTSGKTSRLANRDAFILLRTGG